MYLPHYDAQAVKAVIIHKFCGTDLKILQKGDIITVLSDQVCSDQWR